MATRYQNESIKKEFKRERRRIQRAIKRLKDEGRIVNYTLPPIPKKVTEASVRRLSKITPKYLRSKSEVYDVETMEFVSGWRANRIINEKKERYKERWGKNWREEKRKLDAKIEHERFLDEIYRQEETYEPGYETEPIYDEDTFYDAVDEEVEETKPKDITDITANEEETGGTITYEETDKEGNTIEVSVEYEIDPTTGEVIEKPETEICTKKGSDYYPPETSVIIDNIREAFDRWAPPDYRDNRTAEKKMNDINIARSLLDQAIDEFGSDVVAARLESYAGDIWDLMDTIMYSGYAGNVNYAFVEFRNILFGGTASAEEAMELQDMMDYYDEMGDY